MLEKAEHLAEVLAKHNVEYLFIGKFAAILYGYPGTTQDMDIFPRKEKGNCKRLVDALEELEFRLDKQLEAAILTGRDFIQIRGGPFPIDIIFAPDGIDTFEDAESRRRVIANRFFCASIDDIIASKRASGRQRDKEELHRLELFKEALDKKT